MLATKSFTTKRCMQVPPCNRSAGCHLQPQERRALDPLTPLISRRPLLPNVCMCVFFPQGRSPAWSFTSRRTFLLGAKTTRSASGVCTIGHCCTFLGGTKRRSHLSGLCAHAYKCTVYGRSKGRGGQGLDRPDPLHQLGGFQKPTFSLSYSVSAN